MSYIAEKEVSEGYRIDHPRLIVGAKLGNYTVTGFLASGGMGEVYRAQDERAQRQVALKVLSVSIEKESSQRFMQEARALAALNHPNIVTLYTIDSVGEVPFIAMEYVEGVTFGQLAERQVLSVDEAVPLMLQMLQGLAYMHDHGIVHRDLKPSNIILRSDGTVKILDLGIAKKVGDPNTTEGGIIMGTGRYMPPEIIDGAPATARSDLWAAGAVFYEILTGQPVIRQQNADGTIQYPPETHSWIPLPFRNVIAKMCSPRPLERFTSAKEIAAKLESLIATRQALKPQRLALLSRPIENGEEVQKKLSAEFPPAVAKRIFTIAIFMQDIANVRQRSDVTAALNEAAPFALSEGALAKARQHVMPSNPGLTIETVQAPGPRLWPAALVAALVAGVALYHFRAAVWKAVATAPYMSAVRTAMQKINGETNLPPPPPAENPAPARPPAAVTPAALTPLQVLRPMDGAAYQIPGQLSSVDVPAAWECTRPKGSSYEVRVQDAFGKADDLAASECNLLLKNLPAGDYSVRVRSRGEAAWGEPVLFTVRGGSALPFSKFKSKTAR